MWKSLRLLQLNPINIVNSLIFIDLKAKWNGKTTSYLIYSSHFNELFGNRFGKAELIHRSGKMLLHTAECTETFRYFYSSSQKSFCLLKFYAHLNFETSIYWTLNCLEEAFCVFDKNSNKSRCKNPTLRLIECNWTTPEISFQPEIVSNYFLKKKSMPFERNQ